MPLLESVDKWQLAETETACSAPLSLQSIPLHHSFSLKAERRQIRTWLPFVPGHHLTNSCQQMHSFHTCQSAWEEQPGNRGSHFLSEVLYLSSGGDETSLLRDEICFQPGCWKSMPTGVPEFTLLGVHTSFWKACLLSSYHKNIFTLGPPERRGPTKLQQETLYLS